MQKRASASWLQVARLVAAATVLIPVIVAGQIFCAGVAISGPGVIGGEPIATGRGADEGVLPDDFGGPVKQ